MSKASGGLRGDQGQQAHEAPRESRAHEAPRESQGTFSPVRSRRNEPPDRYSSQRH